VKKKNDRPVNAYVWSLEYGYLPRGIPERPLVRPTLKEYKETFRQKVTKAKTTFREIWT
jgi:hypothetical protein